MRPGMIFAEDVLSSKGLLLIARGHGVTASLLERIQNSLLDHGIREPVQMILKKKEPAAEVVEPAVK